MLAFWHLYKTNKTRQQLFDRLFPGSGVHCCPKTGMGVCVCVVSSAFCVVFSEEDWRDYLFFSLAVIPPSQSNSPHKLGFNSSGPALPLITASGRADWEKPFKHFMMMLSKRIQSDTLGWNHFSGHVQPCVCVTALRLEGERWQACRTTNDVVRVNLIWRLSSGSSSH